MFSRRQNHGVSWPARGQRLPTAWWRDPVSIPAYKTSSSGPALRDGKRKNPPRGNPPKGAWGLSPKIESRPSSPYREKKGQGFIFVRHANPGETPGQVFSWPRRACQRNCPAATWPATRGGSSSRRTFSSCSATPGTISTSLSGGHGNTR